MLISIISVRNVGTLRKQMSGAALIMDPDSYRKLEKPLPARANIVVASPAQPAPAGCYHAQCFGEALRIVDSQGFGKLFVIASGALRRVAAVYARNSHA